jgi:hypothetical protein
MFTSELKRRLCVLTNFKFNNTKVLELVVSIKFSNQRSNR